MKKILFGFILVSFLFACGKKEIDFSKLQNRNGVYYEVNQETGFSGTANEYYGNKSLKRTVTIEKGVFSGPTTEFYSNGQVKYKGNFINGKLSIEKSYFENGQIRSELLPGEKENEKVYKVYYKSGALRSTTSFINGVQNGATKEYDRDGNLITNQNILDKIFQYTEDLTDQIKGN